MISGFEAYLAELPEAVSVFVVSGDDDFVVHVAVPDIERLHAFLMDRFSARREVVSFPQLRDLPADEQPRTEPPGRHGTR